MSLIITPNSLPTWDQFKTSEYYRLVEVIHPEFGIVPYGEHEAYVSLRSGEMYRKKEPDQIANICCAMLLMRPLIIVCKTTYHLFLPLSIPYEIIYALKRNPRQSKRKVVTEAIANSIADIVRTPIFEMILLVQAVCTVHFFIRRMSSVLQPEIAMLRMQIAMGDCENRLTRGDKSKCLVKCFQRFDHLHLVARHQETRAGVNYKDENDQDVSFVEKGLINLGYRMDSTINSDKQTFIILILLRKISNMCLPIRA